MNNQNNISKKVVSIIIVLLSLNIILTTLFLYNQRKNHEHVCLAISAINDSVMTKLNGTAYDERTAGIFDECVSYQVSLIKGF